MKLLSALGLVALGLIAGWFLREAYDPSPATPSRKNRVAGATHEEHAKSEAGTEQRAAPPGKDPPPEPANAEPESEPDPKSLKIDDPEAKKFAKFMRGMLPLLKMQSGRKGREEAAELAKVLELDEQREKRLAEVLARNEVRKMEQGVIPLLEGTEPDEEMLAILQEEDGISAALENDLSEFLSAHEIDRLKAHNREQAAKRRIRNVDIEIQSLAIPDLDEGQERQLREILIAEQEQDTGSSFSASTGKGGPGMAVKMKKSMTADGMVDSIDERYAARRDKLARFLTPVQLEHIDKQHAEERKEAKASEGILGGLLGALVAPQEQKKKD